MKYGVKPKKCINNPSKRCYEITETCHCHFCSDAREKHAAFIDKRIIQGILS